MNPFLIEKYQAKHESDWNTFVLQSKNTTFLFHRSFMNYHQDRFHDNSLLVFKDKKIIAAFPANKVDDKIYSHQGLTYGGLILSKVIKFETVLTIFSCLLKYLSNQGIGTVELKQMPVIYNTVPADEIQYLNFILKSKLYRRDLLSVVEINKSPKISGNRIEGYKRAQKHQLTIKEEGSFNLFWNEILIKNLKNKHGAKPVHTLEEITLLKKNFPENIRQFNVYHGNKIVAGTTIFETETVAHCQYISGNKDKNQLGCLDFLQIHLIKEVFKDKKYYDFGISNENNGSHVNKGLLFWKEGFGARSITQDFYQIETKNYYLLDTVLI